MKNQTPPPVLLVDDDRMVREALAQTLELGGYQPITAASFIEAKDHISRDFQGVVVSDIRMPGKDGFALLEHVQKIDKHLPVILLTGEGDVPMAVRGIGHGAFDFLEKPCDPKYLIKIITKAVATRQLVVENRKLKKALEMARHEKVAFLGCSEAAAHLREVITRAGRLVTPVLISGAVGTGRGHVARLIVGLHGNLGLRRIDCASPFDLSDLAATPDAILLCNIEKLNLSDQARLLADIIPTKGVHILATCGPDIEKSVQSGSMNDDLFYHLGVMRIHVADLAERREDVPVLFDRFLREEIDAGAILTADQMKSATLELQGMSWPANLKSLRNHAKRVAWGLHEDVTEMGLKAQMERVERGIIAATLQQYFGHATRSAQALGLPRKTFYDRLSKLRIRAEDYRES
ncbi:MAG: two-component system C4-dicarboxylate transport response regulator DctD [Paracoccaceae bacterium]|jgi:two-component system C4-dicarboxylate transport response regulator DctD